MKKWTFLILALSFIVLPTVIAVDFIPQGNISLQNVYWIKNNPAGSCGSGLVVNGILANGSWNCTASSSSSGDITDVNAGTGITVTNPTGPAPTVTLNTTYTSSIYVNRSAWTSIDNYPTNCIANYFVQGLNDTLNCSRPVPESDSNWALHDAYPIACGTGYAISGLGDSLTCVTLDPKIAYITANKMCVGNGTGEAINCTATIPVDTDTWASNFSLYYTIVQANASYVKNSSWLNCAGTNNFTSSLGVCSTVSFTGYYTSSQTDTAISNANTSMKSYVDARDTATNTSATTYSDARLSAENSSMKAYVDARDTAINTSATTYSDAKDTATNTSMKNYVDGRDTATNTSATVYSDARLTSVDTATNTTVVNWANAIFDKKTDTLNCGRMTGNTSDLCTITPGGTDTFAQNISAVGACDSTNKLYILSGNLACDNDLMGEGGTGENYWVDGGAYVYPNSTYASNLAIFGYINSTDWSNISITNWVNQMNNYPATCGSNTVAITIGDTLTCVGIANSYILANAINTSQIVDGTILSGDISGGAITNSLIAANAVNSSQIVDGTILSGDIAGGAITNTLIAANAVNGSQITGFLTCSGSNNFTTGFGACGQPSGYLTEISNWATQVNNYPVACGANTVTTTIGDTLTCVGISNTYILANAINSSQIIDAAIASGDIAGGAITNTLIAVNAVNSSQIVDATISSGDIAGGAITNTKIANGAINNTQILDGNTINDSQVIDTITASNYVRTSTWTDHNNYPSDCSAGYYVTGLADTLTCTANPLDTIVEWNTLCTNCVQSADIAGGAVTNVYIGANAVNSSQIVDATIASGDIAGGAITNTLIGAAAINASQLAINIDATTRGFIANETKYWNGTVNLAMNNYNVTAVQCILFQSGGKICSG